jgi:1,4-dihydroxy-2-naphthoate octaprenyltransferase
MVIAGAMPKTELLALLTLPLAYKAIRGSFSSDKLDRLIPAMGSNVMTVLGIPLLMGIGYVLATVFPALR